MSRVRVYGWILLRAAVCTLVVVGLSWGTPLQDVVSWGWQVWVIMFLAMNSVCEFLEWVANGVRNSRRVRREP